MALIFMEGWDDFSGSDSDQSDTTYRSTFAARNVGNPLNTPFVTGRGGYGKAICAQDPPYLTSGYESFAVTWKPVGRCFIGFAWDLIVYTNSGSTDVIRIKSGGSNVFTLQKLSLTSFSINWTTIGGSGTTSAVIAPWRNFSSYCEFCIDPGAATIQVRVDGVLVYTAISVLIPGTIDSLVGTSSLTSQQWAAVVDDLYVNDDTGAYNNNFWGDTRIISIPPIVDGDIHTMIPSRAGTHFDLVNEVPPDEDTTYVSATAVGQEDTYNFPSPPTTGSVGTLYALQVMEYAKTELGGLVKTKGVVRKSGVDYLGAESSIPAVWTGIPTIFETNPATGTIWNVADVPITQFGVERTG